MFSVYASTLLKMFLKTPLNASTELFPIRYIRSKHLSVYIEFKRTQVTDRQALCKKLMRIKLQDVYACRFEFVSLNASGILFRMS
jgi:hypothetical protein